MVHWVVAKTHSHAQYEEEEEEEEVVVVVVVGVFAGKKQQ